MSKSQHTPLRGLCAHTLTEADGMESSGPRAWERAPRWLMAGAQRESDVTARYLLWVTAVPVRASGQYHRDDGTFIWRC